MCSKLAIQKAERRRRRSGVFIVNFEHISHLVIVLQFLTIVEFQFLKNYVYQLRDVNPS